MIVFVFISSNLDLIRMKKISILSIIFAFILLEKSIASGQGIEQVKDLPLIITNPKIEDKVAPVALLISGDGGWYGFEQSIADNLANLGIPTVGLDSRKYFWNRRTPEETAADIARALSFYGKKWGRNKFMLIGYSVGAELVPFIVTRLPENVKSETISAVLLSPDLYTDFEVHFTNMLGMGNPQNIFDVVKEIKSMQPLLTLCIFGDGEKSKVPGLLAGTSVKIKVIPGDHHYKFNLPLIIQTMKENGTF